MTVEWYWSALVLESLSSAGILQVGLVKVDYMYAYKLRIMEVPISIHVMLSRKLCVFTGVHADISTTFQ